MDSEEPRPLAGIACITFDLDDTLWDCAPVIEAAERTLHDWLDARCPGFARALPFEAFIAERARHYRANPRWHHDMTALRRDFLQQLLVRHGCDPGLLQAALDVFLQARNAVCLYHNAAPALERLGRRFRLGVVTNGNADVRRIGIDHLFDFVVTTAEVGVPKPDPRLYRTVADRSGLAAERILHVGDDPERDVWGAAMAGMKTAWVNPRNRAWPRTDCRPDLVIGSVDELPVLFAVESAS
ncbi:MAG: HAD family hydrolase [Gammaproteobacteria bacterium]|nr:MAG: HAD family hydrolase [Gammaproteobacteria bacterium]